MRAAAAPCWATDCFAQHRLRYNATFIGAVYESEALSETTKDGYSDIEEIRLISDLRIMHAKVDELYGIVENLKRRHSEAAIVEYADRQVLPENISRVDEIYMWFVKVKEEMERRNGELD